MRKSNKGDAPREATLNTGKTPRCAAIGEGGSQRFADGGFDLPSAPPSAGGSAPPMEGYEGAPAGGIPAGG